MLTNGEIIVFFKLQQKTPRELAKLYGTTVSQIEDAKWRRLVKRPLLEKMKAYEKEIKEFLKDKDISEKKAIIDSSSQDLKPVKVNKTQLYLLSLYVCTHEATYTRQMIEDIAQRKFTDYEISLMEYEIKRKILEKNQNNNLMYPDLQTGLDWLYKSLSSVEAVENPAW